MMSSDENERRYQEIMRRIERQSPKNPFSTNKQEPSTPQERILDNLNAYDQLNTVLSHRYGRVLCYGPKTTHNTTQAAVIGWYRNKGYHGYKHLYLLGIWVLLNNTEHEVIVGTKTLVFSAPFYESEAYQKLIRKNYTTYYTDDGLPPKTSGVLFQAIYAQEHRLTLRQKIADTLQQWVINSAT